MKDIKANLDAVLNGLVSGTSRVPGVVAMVTDRDGDIYSGAAGERRIGGDPMTEDTVFAIFSTTKAIAGTTALQCVEEGLLDLDAPAKEYAPAIGNLQVIEGFDAESDMIVLPDGLINAGNASSAGAGQFVVYQSSEMYSDIEFFDPWDAMYLNIPQSPKNKFVVEWNDGNGTSQILVDEDPTGKVFSGLDAVA